MKLPFAFLILLQTLLLFGCKPEREIPMIRNGILQVENQKGPIRLSGDWLATDSENQNRPYYFIPDRSFPEGKTSLVLETGILNLIPDQSYAIGISPTIHTIKVSINGSVPESCPEQSLQTCLFFFTARGNDRIQIQSTIGIFRDEPVFPLPPEILPGNEARSYLMKHDRSEWFITGSLFVIGFIHLLFFLGNRRERSFLYLSLFTLSLASRNFFLLDRPFDFLEGDAAWMFRLRAERFFSYMALPSFVWFFHSVLQSPFSPRIHRMIVLFMIFLGTTTLLPGNLYIPLLGLHDLYDLTLFLVGIPFLYRILKAWLSEKNRYAPFLLFGILALFSGIIHDIITGHSSLARVGLVPFTTLLFVLSQSLVVALQTSDHRETGMVFSLEKPEKNPPEKKNHPELSSSDKSPTGVLAIKERKGHRLVLPLPSIFYLSSHGDTTVIHTKEGDFETVNLIKTLEQKLPRNRFVRVHRQFMVNMAYIDRIEYLMGGSYVLFLKDKDETEIPVGRTYYKGLKMRLGLE